MVINVGWREQSLVHVQLFSARLEGQMKTTLLTLSKGAFEIYQGAGQNLFSVAQYFVDGADVNIANFSGQFCRLEGGSRWVYDK